jgi:hypothetical protein
MLCKSDGQVWLAALILCGVASSSLTAGEPKKEPEKRSGTVVGVVTKKEANFIEVKAAGEEQARRYVPRWVGGAPAQGGGPDKKMLQTIAKVKVGSRVRLEWEFEERPRVVKLEVLQAPAGTREEGSGEKKGEEPRPEGEAKKTGKVVGVVTAKGENWIEVKAPGEEKARRYTLYYQGKNKDQVLRTIKETPIGSRVQLDWLFQERLRVIHLQTLTPARNDARE